MEKIRKWLSARVTKRAKPAKLPLGDGDGEGQQSPGLASYQYSSLSEPTHIRVLDILPGNFNSDVRFRLRERRLGDGDIYYAVSYAWGPPVLTHKLYSAEGFIQVTENLWEALRRYRDEDETITLWVDAVCIDQTNIQERAQQVVLMRSIYSESKRVLIWLGLESPSDRSAFEFITRVINCFYESTPDRDALSDKIIPILNNEYQDAVTELFAKSWFSRVWTFQEIICAAEAALTSGSLVIEFEDVQSFCIIWVVVKLVPWLKSNASQRALSQVASLHATRDHLSEQSAVNSLFQIVKRTRTRLATDPKDKIYGLVALASDINPLPFTPTYKTTVNHLFEEFAAHVIRQNENLDIFHCCNFQHGLRKWPSWVPDWRYSDKLTMPINREKDSFRAAGSSCWDTSTAIVNHSLGVEAMCLDRLQNVTSPGPSPNFVGLSDWDNGWLLRVKWHQNTIRETMEMTSISLLYSSEQERWHAWWRTIIGERNREMERATPDYEQRVRGYQEALDQVIYNDPDLDIDFEFAETSDRVGAMAKHRRFCLSREGRIGWVPIAARIGDIVSLLRGSPVPVIIRPSWRRKSYLMIGQAYIHGIMDGEAVAGKEDQFQRIQLV